MPPLYIVEQGAKLQVESRRLVVSKEGETLLKVPFAHTNAVVIFGNVSITTPAMKRLMAQGIDVIFLSSHGQYEGRLVGEMSKFGLLRRQQYEITSQPQTCLTIAQTIVQTKIHNMRIFLMRYARRHENDQLSTAIQRLAELIPRAPRTTNPNSLRGVEGIATALYFGAMRTLYKHDWDFNDRNRRPPKDPVNVLLSFGYTLLSRAIEASVSVVGLDPYIGVFHTIEYGRPSLALDLTEEFRTIIIDSVVLRCLNNEIITRSDFSEESEGMYPLRLSDGAKRRYIQEYEARLETPFKHPITHEQVTYRQSFELQARFMAKVFREANTPYQAFKVAS